MCHAALIYACVYTRASHVLSADLAKVAHAELEEDEDEEDEDFTFARVKKLKCLKRSRACKLHARRRGCACVTHLVCALGMFSPPP